MSDEVRQLKVEVEVLERAVHRFEERLAGLREETAKGFDRIDIVLANQFGETLMLLNEVNRRVTLLDNRVNDLERDVRKGFADVLEAIRSLKG